MKKRFYNFITAFSLFFGFSQALGAEESAALNYTYLGPIMSIGYSSVEYSKWDDSEYKAVSSSGINYSGGVVLCIFAGNYLGDTKIRYAYDGTDDSMTYAEFSFSAKYLWKLSNAMNAGLGLGVYCETPPSNKSHNGSAGLELPLALIVDTSINTKLYTEISLKYGSYGLGEDTSRLYYGCSVGFIIKVGRI